MCIFQSEEVIKLWFYIMMFKSYTQLPFMDEKAKGNASYYITKLLPNLIKDAGISCRTTSSFSKMAHLLTQQPLPKTGSRRNVLVSLEKTNGHRIRQISVH